MLTIALLGIPFYGHGASSVIIGIIVLAALGTLPVRKNSIRNTRYLHAP